MNEPLTAPRDIAKAAPHIAIRPEWLALRTEPTLKPDLPIIDAHHHL